MRLLENNGSKKKNYAQQEAMLLKEEELFNESTASRKEANEIYEYLKTDRFILDTHSESEIAAFYRDRSIFITGASGFVGKVSFRRASKIGNI